MDYEDACPEGKIVGDYVIHLKKMLGKGKFGEVYEAIHKTTNIKVAVKVSPNHQRLDKEGIKKILQDKEVQVLQKLKHDNLIFMHEFKITQNNIYLFIEYCNGGNLLDYLTKKQFNLTDLEILKLLKQVCEGFEYMYRYKIMHRDLKPENIMIHNGNIKISDFGFARIIEGDQNTALNFTLKGTPLYFPPQIFDGQKYSSKFDIWSLGSILFEMMYQGIHYLSEVKSLKQLQQKLLSFKDLPPQIPESNRNPKLVEVLIQMLQYEEQERISWEQIFEHDFYKNSAEKFLGPAQEDQVVKVKDYKAQSVEFTSNFDSKIRINNMFYTLMRLMNSVEITSQLSDYKISAVKCYILQCQIERIISLEDAIYKVHSYKQSDTNTTQLIDYFLALKQKLIAQLGYHTNVLDSQTTYVIQFMEQSPYSQDKDEKFLKKLMCNKINKEDIQSIIPENNVIFERIQYGIYFIAYLQSHEQSFVVDLQAVIDLSPVETLMQIKQLINK